MSKLRTARDTAYNDEDDACETTSSNKVISEVTARVWGSHGGGVYEPCPPVVPGVPAGYYQSKPLGGGRFGFERIEILGDALSTLPDSIGSNLTKSLDKFWTRKDDYHKAGLLWKRGILLYGPPGSGKTSIVRSISDRMITGGGIAYYITNPPQDFDLLKAMRVIEPNRPLIVIFEDIDEIIRYYGESSLLSILDGEIQLENVVYVATTNYVGALKGRFVNRPSRFDELHLVALPNEEQRTAYISQKCPSLYSNDLHVWVDITEGFSIAHIKELIVCVSLFDIPLYDAAQRLHEMNLQEDNDKTTLKKAALPKRVAGVINSLRKKAGKGELATIPTVNEAAKVRFTPPPSLDLDPPSDLDDD